jgi:hypothetical protein
MTKTILISGTKNGFAIETAFILASSYIISNKI